jgi:hypothetical protein
MNDKETVDSFSSFTVSKVTISFLFSLISLAAFITWNASSINNRIISLEESLTIIQQANSAADSGVLARLVTLETSLNNLANIDVNDEISELEELVDEIETRLDEDFSWQLGDLFYRTDLLTEALRTQQWGVDFMNQQYNQGPWP